jgi:membrane associated rhomboid family serine protease
MRNMSANSPQFGQLARATPITFALIAISALVFLASGMGESLRPLQGLLIASPGSYGYQDIAAGQWWRLLTPIFIHFGIMHIVFNMMWIWDLGRLVEYRRGSVFYLLFTVVVGILSNVAQYSIGHSPFFGGMSGMVYGLLGYVWMQGRYNPAFGIALHKSTVTMMLVWYVLCWTGLLGAIANWAHTAGLLIGVAWGLLAGKGERRH